MSTFISLEPEDRRELLRAWGQKFNLKTLVETGTNEGKTPLALNDSFEQIFTIELDGDLFARAKDMFASFPNVTCMRGDSTDLLPQVLAGLTDPALFWLDGHYSGPGTGHGAKSSPICEELALILGDDKAHVVLVDDARIFDGGPEHTLYDHYLEYPSLKWVKAFAEEHDYHYELHRDIIRLTP